MLVRCKHATTVKRVSPTGKRWCPSCQARRGAAWYLRNRSTELLKSKKRYEENKEKVIAQAADWRTKNRERSRELARAWYHKNKARKQGPLLALLGNSCVICGSKHRLVVDHDHKTDRIRGRLCSNCNTALGLVRECTGTLKNMINYIEVQNELTRTNENDAGRSYSNLHKASGHKKRKG